MGATHAAPTRAPLTGADCFLRAFDREIRRLNRAGHVSQLVLRLGPGFDADGFRALVLRAARAQPILRAPIARRALAGPAEYRLDSAPRAPLPRVLVHDVAESEPLPEVFRRRLNERLACERGELLRFDLARRGDGGTDLAMSWIHMLFDGSGSERFVRWLDDCFRGARSCDELPVPDELAPAPKAPAGAGERGQAALAWKRWMDGLGARPPRSLAGPLRRVRQDLRYDVHAFDRDESARVAEAAKRRAGFLTPMLFYLAAAIRAHHAVFLSRGVDPRSYLVPLPVDLRPKGRDGAIFRTHVSLLWFQVLPDEVGDLEKLLESLRSQRREAIRAGRIEAGRHAMDFARLAPGRLYAHMARRGLGGELCSFFFAFTGEFLAGLESFCGAELRRGFHVAPVPPSPGSCVALSFSRGHLHATHVFQSGVVSDREREIFRDQLRSDLLA